MTPREISSLQALQLDLNSLHSVTCALQKENIDLYDVRVLYDEILDLYPFEEFQRYLLPNSTIVNNPDFDNGVIKILQGNITTLNQTELNAVYLLKTDVKNHVLDNEGLKEDAQDFASLCLKKRRTKEYYGQRYMDCKFLLPTSNIVERFFSSVGYAFNESRQALLPINLETQLFLKVNRSFWSEELVSKIYNEDEK